MSSCENGHPRPATPKETAAALKAHFHHPNDSSPNALPLSDQTELKRAEHRALIDSGHTLVVLMIPDGNGGEKPIVTYEKGLS